MLACAWLIAGSSTAQGVIATPPPPPARHAAPLAGAFDATLTAIGPGRASVVATLDTLAGRRSLEVVDADARSKLAHARPGDVARIETDDVENPTLITRITEVDRPTTVGQRLIALAAAALIVALAVASMTRWNPGKLLVGEDNRYSNSQCQLALWFGVVATVYLATVFLRSTMLGGDFIGGVSLTANVITMTGFSALTFGAAKVVTAQKVANVDPGAPHKVHATSPPRLIRDLSCNDLGRADLGDVEMILVTVASAILFLVQSFFFLGRLRHSAEIALPDIDSALLSAFGLGQGAYLIKKTAMPLGHG